MSQFDALKECGGCRHWICGRAPWPNIGTCAIKNAIRGYDLVPRDFWCNKWESRDSGPIVGTQEYRESRDV